MAAKRTADELDYHWDMLNDLFHLIHSTDQAQALKLLDIIRANASTEDVGQYIDETLAGIEKHEKGSQETVNKLQGIWQSSNIEGTGPTYHRKVMDIHYLCNAAPESSC